MLFLDCSVESCSHSLQFSTGRFAPAVTSTCLNFHVEILNGETWMQRAVFKELSVHSKPESDLSARGRGLLSPSGSLLTLDGLS